MKLQKADKIYCDDTSAIKAGDIFVLSNQNKQYIKNLPKNTKIIKDIELVNCFDIKDINIVAVCGTNGKTTTTACIYSMMLDLGYKVALQGGRGFFVNDTKLNEPTLTTPTLLETVKNLIKAVENGCEYFIMEVSSHAIAQDRIIGLNFALKIHTNITQDHLDFHKTLKEYIRVKNSFFSDDGLKLINKDDKNIDASKKNCYTYSLEYPATYKVVAYSLKDGLDISLQNIQNMTNISSPLVGAFNIYNITASVAGVHLLTKRALDDIAKTVENFAGVAGRMQVVSQNPKIVIDFAHTPDAMKNVFDSFATLDIVVVFGAGGDRDKSKRKLMGAVASKFASYSYITSDNPRFEDPDKICDDVAVGFEKNAKYEIEVDRKKAIEKAILSLKNYKNPILFVLGKGDERNQTIYKYKLPFCDASVIKELLDEKGI
ncbi:MAG: UDP-N-acetylmuramoyl-L-alanyl-D-glutamate--2,6-diaminopimelate ligase [Campylobacteraceae bacterium 4484_166]|nr:MAG: UDP-N-acetylmuramoyl-L-alanyl-D-glutamate--2,6-diaminopimelate ligase [Campylobacteraceae bacterium 4484_166]